MWIYWAFVALLLVNIRHVPAVGVRRGATRTPRNAPIADRLQEPPTDVPHSSGAHLLANVLREPQESSCEPPRRHRAGDVGCDASPPSLCPAPDQFQCCQTTWICICTRITLAITSMPTTAASRYVLPLHRVSGFADLLSQLFIRMGVTKLLRLLP